MPTKPNLTTNSLEYYKSFTDSLHDEGGWSKQYNRDSFAEALYQLSLYPIPLHILEDAAIRMYLSSSDEHTNGVTND